MRIKCLAQEHNTMSPANPQQMFLLRVKLIKQGEKREASTKTCNETMLRDKLRVFVSCISPPLRTKGPRNQAFLLSRPAFTGIHVHSFFFARPTDPPSREGGRWETKHFIGMALGIYFGMNLETSLISSTQKFVVPFSLKECFSVKSLV